MDFRDRHVVITGGTRALGAAVVEALIGAGAICHVPCFNEKEAQLFALRDRPQVKLVVAGNLADETAIDRLYQSVGPLWASIHLAGGFAAGPLRGAGIAARPPAGAMKLMARPPPFPTAGVALSNNRGPPAQLAPRPAPAERTTGDERRT